MPTHTAAITKLTRAIQRDPQNREHLFQTLLRRAFAGGMWLSSAIEED